MSREDRAKQFAPFDALTGLQRALAKKRRELGLIERFELSEDAAEALNEKLTGLRRGVTVSVRHYRRGEYIVTSGMLTELDELERCMKIDGETVMLDDVLDVEVTGQ